MESTSRILKLPGCDLETLKLFLYYIANAHTLPDLDNMTRRCIMVEKWQQRFARLWLFGEYFLIPDLQGKALESLEAIFFEDFGVSLEPETVKITFQDTPQRNALHSLIVRKAVQECKDTGQIGVGRADHVMNELAAIPGFFLAFATEVAVTCND